MNEPRQFHAELSGVEIELHQGEPEDVEGADVVVRFIHPAAASVPFAILAMWAHQALADWLRENGGTMIGSAQMPNRWEHGEPEADPEAPGV